tara:strand:- start:1083 stop:1781 length:699 start_codon:yes stop_codon:yes gene_type:complete
MYSINKKSQDTKRYEVKLVLNDQELSIFRLWQINHTSILQSYDARIVNSIYYDDDANSSVSDNISGISKRQKFRVRWYGSDIAEKPTLEIKTRVNKTGLKMNIDFPEENNAIQTLGLLEIGNIFELALRKQFPNFSLNLNPKIQVSYSREYYEDSRGLRITIDQNINFCDVSRADKPFSGVIIPYSQNVIEFKFMADSYPMVCDLLRMTNFLPKRHSKYLIGLAKIGQVNYV